MKYHFFWKAVIIIVASFSINCSLGQQMWTDNIYKSDSILPPKAGIADVAFISGRWQCQIWGGKGQEIWSDTTGNAMHGSFSFELGGKVRFYELITLVEKNGSLQLRIRHFNSDMTSWTNEDSCKQFDLVKLEKNKAFFHGQTYQLIDKNTMIIYAMIGNKGDMKETKFVFKRI